jgi:Family of unknown function (DUF6163)
MIVGAGEYFFDSSSRGAETIMPYAINDDQLKSAQPSLTTAAFVWFHRIVALFCLWSGVTYWIQLIGIYEGPLGRFDLMPVYWQVAASSLAALFPVAASGLWMVVSWGPVIWTAAAAGEVIMYFGFPELFGTRPLLLIAHGAIACLYVAFRLVIYRETRRAAR